MAVVGDRELGGTAHRMLKELSKGYGKVWFLSTASPDLLPGARSNDPLPTIQSDVALRVWVDIVVPLRAPRH